MELGLEVTPKRIEKFPSAPFGEEGSRSKACAYIIVQSCYLCGLLISKLVICSQNDLILEVEVHLGYINLLAEAYYHIMSIHEVITSFWYKNFKLSFEGLRGLA